MTDTLSLKNATRKLVKACNGQLACTLIDGMPANKRHQAFSDYGNPQKADMLPLYMVPLLEAYCGQPFITADLARATGHRLVHLPEFDEAHAPLGRISAEALKEVGDVFSTLGAQLMDGKFTAAEDRELRREIDEAIVKLLQLQAQASAMVEGGAE